MKIIQIGMDEALKIHQAGDEQEYEKFVDKFKEKKTTDDCYTPQNIYDTVAEWVEQEYGVDRNDFIRPFWPGGDYTAQEYPDGCTVVDNPPFSILSEIIRYYEKRKISFFLFAPALTLFAARDTDVSYLATGCGITYENGAEVRTSFITNLDDCRVRTCPELYRRVEAVNKQNLKEGKKELPKYEYPDEVITAALVQKWSHYGVEYRLAKDACVRIAALDDQRKVNKSIFGSGFLLSERAAAERAAACRWQISERERMIQKTLK